MRRVHAVAVRLRCSAPGRCAIRIIRRIAMAGAARSRVSPVKIRERSGHASGGILRLAHALTMAVHIRARLHCRWRIRLRPEKALTVCSARIPVNICRHLDIPGTMVGIYARFPGRRRMTD